MDAIGQRVKRVVSQKATTFVLSRVLSDDRERLSEIKAQEEQARANALARAAAKNKTNQSATEQNRGTGGTEPSAIDEMMDEEDCPICSSVLASIRTMDEPQRTHGVAEYGEFRRAIEQSEEAAVEVLEDSDILQEAMNDVRGIQL